MRGPRLSSHPVLKLLAFSTETGNESGPLEQCEYNACYGHDNDDLTEGNTELEGLDNTCLGRIKSVGSTEVCRRNHLISDVNTNYTNH